MALAPPVSHTLARTASHAQSRTHTLAHSRTLSHTPAHSRTSSHALAHSCILSNAQSRALSHPLARTLSHAHSRALSHTLAHCRTLSRTLHSLSHSPCVPTHVQVTNINILRRCGSCAYWSRRSCCGGCGCCFTSHHATTSPLDCQRLTSSTSGHRGQAGSQSRPEGRGGCVVPWVRSFMVRCTPHRRVSEQREVLPGGDLPPPGHGRGRKPCAASDGCRRGPPWNPITSAGAAAT